MSKDLPAKQQEAVKLVEKSRSEHALVFVNDEDLKTHPLFIPEITILACKQEDFHDIKGKYMPKSYQTDRIGEACGIAFIAEECGTRKEGEWIYVGRAQGKKRQPDGIWRPSHVQEYEYDVEARAELDFAAKPEKYQTEKAKQLHRLELKKFARQRAGTGARLKVIRELVGMPTTFEPEQLRNSKMVFSRIAVNTEEMLADPDTRQAAIKVALGTTNEIFGPPSERNVTPQREALPASLESPREEREEPEKQEKPKQEGLPEFGSIPWEEDERQELRAWFEAQLEAAIPEKTKSWIRAFLNEKDSQIVRVLKTYKEELERKMASAGGGK